MVKIAYKCKAKTECVECNEIIKRYEIHTFSLEDGHICRTCSDLDSLTVYELGNRALTRIVKRNSNIVVDIYGSMDSGTLLSYLVEPRAIAIAEKEYKAGEELREKRKRQREKRQEKARLDENRQHKKQFAKAIRAMFPSIPEKCIEEIISESCSLYNKSSAANSQAGKNLEENPIVNTVKAHIRHSHTHYDTLLYEADKPKAREMIENQVLEILDYFAMKEIPLNCICPIETEPNCRPKP